MIESSGGMAVRFPVIEIIPVSVPENKEETYAELEKSGIIIFVSRNAVCFAETFLPGMFSKLRNREILAIGEGTREELAGKGVENVTCAAKGTGSEALLELDIFNPEKLAGKNAIIVRGVGGRDTIRQHLTQHGVNVRYIEVYRRVMPATEAGQVEKIWKETPPGAIVVTSVEGLRNLINMSGETFKKELLQVPLAVMSSRIRSEALMAGFNHEPAVAATASDKGLMDAITAIFGD